MDNTGWVKLHRKILDNGIMKDATAWQVFSWLLLMVDRKTGKANFGRFWASKSLGLNSNTFYKALLRLSKKWQMVTLSSNNKFTECSLINWEKYQSGNSDGNNKVTTREQQSNTIQEVENIELRILSADNTEKEKHPNKLLLNKSQQMMFLKEFPGLATSELVEQKEKCNAYMTMSSKNYTNPGLFFRGWLRTHMSEKTTKTSIDVETAKVIAPLISPEEEAAGKKKLQEIRVRLKNKFSIN